MTDVRERYAGHLRDVDQVMIDELGHWSWDDLGPMATIVENQIRRGGKRLRPLLALSFVDVLGGRIERVLAPAASVEFYHLAALVLDDVQDNSEMRRGARAVHATSGTSAAINVAAAVRSLSYHPIHRSPLLDHAEKHELHRELDGAATRLVLGQSIDIGWHEGWYSSHLDFPYERMVRWKSGSLFGCAAAMGARVAGADLETVDAARRFGVAFGVLFQMIDDYLDAFGDEGVLRRPRFEDFRAGKMSGPVVRLLHALEAAGRRADLELVAQRLADGAGGQTDRDWLLSIMRECAVEETLRGELLSLAEQLGGRLVGGARVADVRVHELVELITAPVAHWQSPRPVDQHNVTR